MSINANYREYEVTGNKKTLKESGNASGNGWGATWGVGVEYLLGEGLANETILRLSYDVLDGSVLNHSGYQYDMENSQKLTLSIGMTF